MAKGERKRSLPVLMTVLLVIVTAFVIACGSGAKPRLTFMNGDETFRTYELAAGEEITDLGMPTKTGYTFTGWKDGDGADYVPGVMPSESVTVYAQYRPNAYTVTFVAGGGALGSLTDISATYDTELTLPAEGVTSGGREISGYTDIEGSSDVKWPVGSKVVNLTDVDGATVTLYVIYKQEVQPLNYITDNGVVTGFTGYAEHIELPADCTTIAEGAFAGAEFLKTVTVPETYTEIGFGAFEGCNSIEKLTVPFIGGSADENNYLAYIFGASHYTDNNYSYSLNLITDDAGNIISTEIDENTVEGAFYIPRSLRVVTVNTALNSFGEGAFYSAFGLEKVILYSSETEEGSGVYAYPVRTVGAHAFDYCHYLGYDTEIGASLSIDWLCDVEEIGDYAFRGYIAGNYYTSHITYVGELSAAVVIGESAFENNSRLSDLSFGDKLTEIKARAFYGNIFMQKVIIPDSVRTIGEEAFSRCDYMASVEIGSGVESIGNSAFATNIGLSEVIFHGEQSISFGKDVFAGVVEVDEGLMPDQNGNCNAGLKFFFDTEAGRNALSPSLSVYSNGEYALSAAPDTQEYFYLGGSSYAFTVNFGQSTMTINDPYNRAGFGLPYMIGIVTEIPDSDLYDTEDDLYLVSFMADQLHFYLKKTVTYTGMYTHYYNYIVPSIELTQIMDDVYADYVTNGKTQAVQFGSETVGWCIQQNIFGQINLLKDGVAVKKGYDANGEKLDEEVLQVGGGIIQTYLIERLPRTLVYRQMNMYFEPILTYYFTYIPSPTDDVSTLTYNGQLLADTSASPELGEYDNYLFGDYSTTDGNLTVRVSEAENQFVISEKGVGDEYNAIYDGEYMAASGSVYGSYTMDESGDTPVQIYNDYALNDITVDGGSIKVVFRDFYTRVLDRTDGLEINLYAVCDVEIDGVTYRLYNNKLYSRQDCYNVSSNGTRRDHYTLIQYEHYITTNDYGEEITYTEYPGYVEYYDPTGEKYMFGNIVPNEDYDNPKYVFHFIHDGTQTIDKTVDASIVNAEQGIFSAPYGAATREYVPYYSMEEDMTFTNGDTSVWLDGYGNGKLYINGEEQWSGTYSIASETVVANVFVTENSYYYMYEYVLSGPTGQKFYFAPNFYDAYDGSMKAGDMLVPDEYRNKTYVAVEYSGEEQLITALYASSGYGLGMLYIMTAPDGNTLPYSMYIMAPYTYASYEKVEGTENTFRIYDMYGEGFFLCDFTDNMIAASATASYPEMVIADDYAGWWHERVATQISGTISADMDTLERLTSREEKGIYRTPDGYILYLDGKGGAVLYDNSGAMEESNIIAEGSFMSYDDSVLSTTSYRADMTLTFKGGDEKVFPGYIYPTTGRLKMPVEINGSVTDGFAKEAAISASYTNIAGGNDKLLIYTDGYACYYRPDGEHPFSFGTFSDYELNPDPEKAMAANIIAAEGEQLKALSTEYDKTVLTLDDEQLTFTVKASYVSYNFKYGYYTATVYRMPEETAGDDPDAEEERTVNMYGYDILLEDDGNGNWVPSVNYDNEYSDTYFRFYSPEEKESADPDGATAAERCEDFYYYEPFHVQYPLTQCVLYADGSFIFTYIHLDIISNSMTGWYYEVEGAESEYYFVVYNTMVLRVYNWVGMTLN